MQIFSDKTYMALLLSLFINSVIACPMTAVVVRLQREKNGYEFNSLEDLDPEGELRMVACVHTQHDLPTVLDLIEISGAPSRRHLTPCILHLRELAHTATASDMLYHQAQEENGTNAEAMQVNFAIDTFIRDTSINVRRGAAASSLGSMHKDLDYAVQEMHASIAVIPLHCKRRFDGKVGTVKAEARELTMNVLRHVPCSVGILVDRGLGQPGRSGAESSVSSASLSLSLSPESMMVDVVVVFLGGADDREAAAYAARLARHPSARVTMVRFMATARDEPGSQSRTSSWVSESSNAAVEVDVEEGDDRDEVFIANFYNRSVYLHLKDG